ncbi:hypothetical protein [Methylobacterium isbiliense]|uniref:Uncharacterized protein n=1 Tax=Methylobacterium isbiliense TaxID=315478 RepID=A0ABQ4SMF3_9HYPH|nr:hypothetical protein [Methylobacterium isbiliense]MDN3624568.1 hypothetical protein [Methylobacterium isbiliense]GJE03481.1 hypothetical protein GMJLKIPL_5436 [Methylobacterium isbiliense]
MWPALPGTPSTRPARIGAARTAICGACLAAVMVLAGDLQESRSSGLARPAEGPPPLPGYRACDAYRRSLAARGARAAPLVRQVQVGDAYAIPASRAVKVVIACVAVNSLHQVGLTTGSRPPAGLAAWFEAVALAVASLRPDLAPDEVQALVSVVHDGAGAKARQNFGSTGQYIGDDHIRLQDYILQYTVSERRHHFGIHSDKQPPSE